MATLNKLEEFNAWSKARELNLVIHKFLLKSEFRHYYDLKMQMQKSSRSIMANLAEGFGRKGNLEFINFISISQGSLFELRSDCIYCENVNLISKAELEQAISIIDELGKLSNGMLRFLKQSRIKGSKFNRK